jgi:hypothetical protein
MGVFLTFLRLAALEFGQAVNYSKIASAIGVALNAIRNFHPDINILICHAFEWHDKS